MPADRRGSLQSVIKPFVERTPQPRLDLFAKALAVILRQMCIVCLPAPPDLNDGEMVGSHYVLKKLETHQTRVFAAIRSKLLQRFYRNVAKIREDIHVSDDVRPPDFAAAFCWAGAVTGTTTVASQPKSAAQEPTRINFNGLGNISNPPGLNLDKKLSYAIQQDGDGTPEEAFRKQIAISGPGAYLFPNPENPSGYQASFKKVWATTLRKAGIPYFRIYDLRSTYATRLSAGGVADEWVTQLLRQGDAKVFKKYSQMKREAR